MSTGREVFSCNICGTVYSRTYQNWTDNCPECNAHPSGNATLISGDDMAKKSDSLTFSEAVSLLRIALWVAAIYYGWDYLESAYNWNPALWKAAGIGLAFFFLTTGIIGIFKFMIRGLK